MSHQRPGPIGLHPTPSSPQESPEDRDLRLYPYLHKGDGDDAFGRKDEKGRIHIPEYASGVPEGVWLFPDDALEMFGDDFLRKKGWAQRGLGMNRLDREKKMREDFEAWRDERIAPEPPDPGPPIPVWNKRGVHNLPAAKESPPAYEMAPLEAPEPEAAPSYNTTPAPIAPPPPPAPGSLREMGRPLNQQEIQRFNWGNPLPWEDPHKKLPQSPDAKPILKPGLI